MVLQDGRVPNDVRGYKTIVSSRATAMESGVLIVIVWITATGHNAHQGRLYPVSVECKCFSDLTITRLTQYEVTGLMII